MVASQNVIYKGSIVHRYHHRLENALIGGNNTQTTHNFPTISYNHKEILWLQRSSSWLWMWKNEKCTICLLIKWKKSILQHMEVHGICTCQDRRAESEGSQSKAAGHLRLYLPSAAMWRPAAETPDPAQVTHWVSSTSSVQHHQWDYTWSKLCVLAEDALSALFCLTRSGKQRWITAMFPSDPFEDMEQASENVGQ